MGLRLASVSVDGHFLVTADADGKITLWRFPGPVLLKSIQVNKSVTSLALNTNATKVLVTFVNGTSYSINIATGVTDDVFMGSH
jgi:hypothetical protein